jgi:hypothetical protein
VVDEDERAKTSVWQSIEALQSWEVCKNIIPVKNNYLKTNTRLRRMSEPRLASGSPLKRFNPGRSVKILSLILSL